MADDKSESSYFGKFRMCLCELTCDIEVVRISAPHTRCKSCRDEYLREINPESVRDALDYTIARYSKVRIAKKGKAR